MANWPARACFDIRCDKSQRKFNMVVCWIPECMFRVRAALKDKIGCLEITVLDDTHTTAQELEEIRPEARAYIKAISPALYTECMFLGPRFGKTASDIVKFANAFYLEERSPPTVEMARSIWHKEVHRRFLHLPAARAINRSQLFTPWATVLLRASERFAASFDVAMSNDNSGTDSQNGREWIVDLVARTCCHRFQDTGVPCGHAIRQQPRAYMVPLFTVERWISTYSSANLTPLDQDLLGELKGDQAVHMGNILGIVAPEPPLTVVPSGRPAVKRRRKGDVRRPEGSKQQAVAGALPDVRDRAPLRCSVCKKKTGHYAPKCRQPPIVDSLEWHLVVVPRKITILALVRRRNYDISLALTKFGFFSWVYRDKHKASGHRNSTKNLGHRGKKPFYICIYRSRITRWFPPHHTEVIASITHRQRILRRPLPRTPRAALVGAEPGRRHHQRETLRRPLR